ncbi:hypothetical protein [Citrobacter braakii]|uniref:hypothetical protein n=1 Tax=Citrobacter braakii TaxID=57706 RepID=UPI0011EC5D04|nr:hypothetical protein [Citrobacter braakii]
MAHPSRYLRMIREARMLGKGEQEKQFFGVFGELKLYVRNFTPGWKLPFISLNVTNKCLAQNNLPLNGMTLRRIKTRQFSGVINPIIN